MMENTIASLATNDSEWFLVGNTTTAYNELEDEDFLFDPDNYTEDELEEEEVKELWG